jgi:kumamolisin
MALLGVLGGFALAASGLPAPGFAAEEPRVALVGHVPAALGAATYLGPVDPSQTLTLTLALRPRTNRLLADAVARATPRPASPAPGLSAAYVGRTYGRPDADVDALARYFAGYGLATGAPRPDHLSLPLRGAAGDIQRALGVSLGEYRDARGQRFYATAVEPRLPASLAATVQMIFGLDDYPALHPLHTPLRLVAAPARPAEPGAAAATVLPPYRPADVAAAYDLGPVYARGLGGAGRTIGIIGCSAFDLADVRAFEAAYGLPQASIAMVNVDGGADGADPETALDLEWSNAIAPGAALRVYGFPAQGDGCPFASFYDAIATAVSDNAADVLSISLGACETLYSAYGYLQSMENELAAASLQGQTVLVASGDLGAYCADNGGSLTLGVSYPASSAYVTAVGGTTLTIAQGSIGPTYQGESAWGSWTGCGGPCGGGGGMSALIAAPAWQHAVLGTRSFRAVPDVAYDADPNTGFALVYDGCAYEVGGTSAGAPEWAGLAALADQATGHRLGLHGPQLYDPTALADVAGAGPVFHDVTTGTNLFYAAAPGWDAATGWGTPNAANLVAALLARAPADWPAAVRLYFPIVGR